MAQIILDSNNNLIQGDFDNATLNNRTKLQTTTTNATTNVYVVPNGSSTSAGVSVANNSSLTNASKIVMATNGTTDTQIISGVNGSGTYLPLNFYTNNALSMTIDTNNNVGIGTSTPTASIGGLFVSKYVTSSGINFSAGFTDAINNTFRIGHSSGVAQLFTDAAIAFSTNSTERMRIDTSGNVLIGMSGVSATGARMDVAQQTDSAVTVASFDARQATSGNQYGIFNRLNGDPNNTVNYFFRCNGGATERATIRSNGGIANFSANNVSLSDEREKTNIELAGSYLDKICAIPVKTFNYIDQNLKEDPGLSLGVIAQDVQKVAPELITESNWGTEEEPKERLSIYQTDLQYALMKCIQEQQTIINELKTRIEALESK